MYIAQSYKLVKGGVFLFAVAGHCFGCFSKDPEADKKENQVSISRMCLFGYVILNVNADWSHDLQPILCLVR